MPAREEGERIASVLDSLFDCVTAPCEVLVVVDDPADQTVGVVQAYARAEPRLKCLLNERGSGPASAIRFGMQAAAAPVIVVTMADGSDDARQIVELAELVEAGAVIAAASRYSPGGSRIGGPVLKGLLSRWAGTSLHFLARLGTRDATNSFKAYSASFVRSVGVESSGGFEVGLELTAKARRLRLAVTEIPTTWHERAGGRSRFRLARWLAGYLRWYLFCFGRPLTVEQVRRGRRGHCLQNRAPLRAGTGGAGSD